MKKLFLIVLVIFILLVAIAVGSQNDGVISVNYLLAQATMKVSTFITLSLAGGVVIGLVIMLPAYLHVKWQLAALKQKVVSQTEPS